MNRVLAGLLVPCALAAIGCDGPALKSVTLTIASQPALPAKVTATSIELTAGVAVLVTLHPAKSGGNFSDGLELAADNRQVFAYEVASDKPSNDSATDPSYTSYLFFGPTAGKTTLHVRPSEYARETLRDSGEVDFAVTVTDQTP